MTKERRTITLDWLTFSITDDMSIYLFIKDVLGLKVDNFEFLDGGIARSYRYSSLAKSDMIQIYYSTIEGIEAGFNKGLTLNLSGQGCRQFEMLQWYLNTDWSWYDLFKSLSLYTTKCTRMDLAQDCINSIYTPQYLLQKIYEKTFLYNGTIRRTNKVNAKTGDDDHFSVYIGAKPQQLNVYDKKGERLSKGELYDVENWTRWELRLGQEKADMAFRELLEGRTVADLYTAILNAHYRFVRRTGDTNRSRRPNAKWWDNFLNTSEKVSLLVQKTKPTLEKKEAWIFNGGASKAELSLWLRDLMVYDKDKAQQMIYSRILAQKDKMTDTDFISIAQSIIETDNYNNNYKHHNMTIHDLKTKLKMLN